MKLKIPFVLSSKRRKRGDSRGLMDFAGKGAVVAFMSEIRTSNPETIAELEKLVQARIGGRS